jgi:PIN domain nuclease of toxin-antitoxin system/antitoxin (DNA-binding transcriptional repressor) of toxin-antitoxin stability system
MATHLVIMALMDSYNVAEAKTRLSEVLQRVSEGEEVLLTGAAGPSRALSRSQKHPGFSEPANTIRTLTATSLPATTGGSRGQTTRRNPGMTDRYLLDTHVLLWAVVEPTRLSAGVRSLIEKQQYAVSVASLWELRNKKGKHDAPVRDPASWWRRYVLGPQTPVIPIRTPHVLYLDQLPWRHRDSYHRILMAQSVIESMPLVTADAEIRKYAINMREATS